MQDFICTDLYHRYFLNICSNYSSVMLKLYIHYVEILMTIAFLIILLLAIAIAWFKYVHVKVGKQTKQQNLYT